MGNVAQLICSKISELDAAKQDNVSVNAEKLMAVGIDEDIPEISAKKKMQAVV
jgi:hypothetical protein